MFNKIVFIVIVTTYTKGMRYIFIQEHWLLKNKLHLLQNITNDQIVHGQCSINDNELLSGRPHGS